MVRSGVQDVVGEPGGLFTKDRPVCTLGRFLWVEGLVCATCCFDLAARGQRRVLLIETWKQCVWTITRGTAQETRRQKTAVYFLILL